MKHTRPIYATWFACSLLVCLTIGTAGASEGSGFSGDGTDLSESIQTPYDSLLARLRSIETNGVTTADGDLFLSETGSFDNTRLDIRLRNTAAMVFICCGQFGRYREVRPEMSRLDAFEKDILEACPVCAGSGLQNSQNGGGQCKKCHGNGWRVKDKALATKKLEEHRALALSEVERSRAKYIQEKKQDEAREEKRRKEAAFAQSQRDKGLVQYKGRWMTPEERDRIRRQDKFLEFVADSSIIGCRFRILQIIGDGRALCVNDWSGKIFCLLYATDSAHNRAIAEGDHLQNDLYWCGTYSYTTVQNASSTVSLYAIDLERALIEAVRQGFYED